jgi:Cu2+-exporting ATPase
MLSGDSSVVTQATAAHLAMVPEHVYGELLPQQKVALVQALRASGRTVAVVGDGINDAAAMAHADLSIALGSGTDLACATADIVLLNNDLRDLMAATEIAQHAMCLIQQNKWIVVAPNVAAIAYGVLAVMNPIAGVVINNGTALMAGLNSLRPLRRARNT